ncbi:hypothetical protein OLMES_1914 [Oleiphilus messinensis]|uniref:DUF1232 domain-containing protein n=1 Tax=Oleiphilus messinensis TaxID=141451 RepID=A0A1Y0I668_9GAMM|nr:YkvA family protein [Oleiphilus messinensis]ARU55988.1 hypothetical protein OLMES_1914 [Oleiphilus messinensis]
MPHSTEKAHTNNKTPDTSPDPSTLTGQSLEVYQGRFTERSFWSKLKRATHTAGDKAIYSSLTLYYTAQSPHTPTWCKGVIYGTLGYFISLIDLIPDLTPVLGYSDDITLMLTALATLATHITPEIQDKARETTNRVLGSTKPDSAPAPVAAENESGHSTV